MISSCLVTVVNTFSFSADLKKMVYVHNVCINRVDHAVSSHTFMLP